MLPAATPDVTRIQIVALLQQIATPIVGFGVISNEKVGLLITGLSGVYTLGSLIADAIIRHGRSQAVAHVAGLNLAQIAADAGAGVNNAAPPSSGPPAAAAPAADMPPPGTPIEAAPQAPGAPVPPAGE